MNNEHTPGFYILEKYRCKKLYDITHKYTSCNVNNIKYCCDIIYDYKNTVQNINMPEYTEIGRTESYAYQDLKKKKRLGLFQILKSFVK